MAGAGSRHADDDHLTLSLSMLLMLMQLLRFRRWWAAAWHDWDAARLGSD